MVIKIIRMGLYMLYIQACEIGRQHLVTGVADDVACCWVAVGMSGVSL